MGIYDSIMSSMGVGDVGATVEEGEVNYESLFTSNNLSSSLQDVKGAKSDSSSDLQLATDKVNVKTQLQLAGTAITATATELNYNDVTTLGTVEASKVITADSSGDTNYNGGYILNEQGSLNLRANALPSPYYRFDGSNDYIQITNDGSLNFTRLSFGGWVYCEDYTAEDNTRLMGCAESGGYGITFDEPSEANQLSVFVRRNSGYGVVSYPL